MRFYSDWFSNKFQSGADGAKRCGSELQWQSWPSHSLLGPNGSQVLHTIIGPYLLCTNPMRGPPRWHQWQRIRLPMRETWFCSLGREDPLAQEMATCSSILVWKISWTEEPDGLQSRGLQRVGHNRATKHIQTNTTLCDPFSQEVGGKHWAPPTTSGYSQHTCCIISKHK